MLSAIESVSIGESFALAGIAICIIMGVLASIMGLIYLMSLLFREFDKLKAKRAEKAAPTAPSEPEPTAKGSCGDLVLVDCSEREAAMIMAIVADTTETPLNELRFRSIKLIASGNTIKEYKE